MSSADALQKGELILQLAHRWCCFNVNASGFGRYFAGFNDHCVGIQVFKMMFLRRIFVPIATDVRYLT
ncbi:hypothetical protein D1012_19770 [Pseudotabrizicola alkalilacus]|uniref:Uncharacterized protein n=1 Tax=Pseudotabrizicola alkalilacus TaxID=2305252 RepID=A0A411YXD8_9RHOB|nr:hypothetical protein D1012_19770 [Pseudotabrizicola alkalilacus]